MGMTTMANHHLPEPVLQARAVTAGYGGRTILQGLDLQVNRGEIYALLGSNGAGKTTTLTPETKKPTRKWAFCNIGCARRI